MATNFEPHECAIFVQSTKIGTHENKAIHSSNFDKDSNFGSIWTVVLTLKIWIWLNWWYVLENRYVKYYPDRT